MDWSETTDAGKAYMSRLSDFIKKKAHADDSYDAFMRQHCQWTPQAKSLTPAESATFARLQDERRLYSEVYYRMFLEELHKEFFGITLSQYWMGTITRSAPLDKGYVVFKRHTQAECEEAHKRREARPSRS
jgi:hypothetical protein